jgi:hypothetical protein
MTPESVLYLTANFALFALVVLRWVDMYLGACRTECWLERFLSLPPSSWQP